MVLIPIQKRRITNAGVIKVFQMYIFLLTKNNLCKIHYFVLKFSFSSQNIMFGKTLGNKFYKDLLTMTD